METAIVTGAGQDSSYLTEMLLDRGYKVVTLIRRASYPNTKRLDHLKMLEESNDDKFTMDYFDLSDATSINNAIRKYQPDVIFNLAAQSHVGISFKVPESTIDFNMLGPLRILEAIKEIKPDCKFYQASSSEMFGISPPPQKEDTPFMPCSPYGVAKLGAYHLVRTYRQGYGIHASNGILFNHETMADFMPVFVKEGNNFDIKPFSDVLTFIDKSKEEYQAQEISGIEILGKEGWTPVKYASGYPHKIIEDNKKPKLITGRCGSYLATGNHVAFLEDEEKKTEDIVEGDKFETIEFKLEGIITDFYDKNKAELIGMLVADGYIQKGKSYGKFTKNDEKIRDRFKELWEKVVGTELKEHFAPSGFKKGNFVKQLIFNKNEFLEELDLYTSERDKKIPKIILNSNRDSQMAFLRGYNDCDGLKKDKCTYEFKSFKTTSATLAQGLWYLTDILLPKQRKTLNTDFSKKGNIVYHINLNSPRGIKSHLSKSFNEITKTIDMSHYDGWFYDIETESNEFISGVGNIHVHNSERRGLNFVTRKITLNIAEIVAGLRNKITLGNLDAKRDWGHSKDYMRAIIEIMEADEPMDVVISTGETYSIREFLEEAFNLIGLNWEDYVEINDKFKRPFDVPALLGDNSKAMKTLKWRPEIKFQQLVKEMLENDLQEVCGFGIETATQKMMKNGGNI